MNTRVSNRHWRMPGGAMVALFCLFLGVMIYALFRPTTLIGFGWLESLGLLAVIEEARSTSEVLSAHIPGWVIFSMPFALGVLGYLVFIDALWDSIESPERHFWLWLVPLMAITSEILQAFRLLPGVFDIQDLVFVFVALSAWQALRVIRFPGGGKKDAQEC